MLGLRLTSAPRAALLARDRARSDDLETDDGPDPVPPPAEPPIHPFTGKFADAEHTVVYQSQAFRKMMPLHIVAMAVMIGTLLFVLAHDATTGNAASDAAAEVAKKLRRRRTACLVFSVSRVGEQRRTAQKHAIFFFMTFLSIHIFALSSPGRSPPPSVASLALRP